MLTPHFRTRTNLLLVAAITLLVFAYPARSSAPDILVTTTSDSLDFGGAQQVADLPGPDGVVSLREAIIAANGTPGPQVIGFNILTSDPGFDGTAFTIRPLSNLPSLDGGGTTIDGATQTALTGNTNSVGPEVVLSGTLISSGADGIPIHSPNNVIHSLVINGFGNNPGVCCGIGIDITGAQANGNIVTACFIGLDANGTTAIGNGDDGVTMSRDAANNRIGGTSIAERNVISGNVIRGVSLFSDNNLVLGNFIGTDATGTIAIGNGEQDGISGAGSNNLIEGNVISGNRTGVRISGSGNTVRGNFLGTDVTGTVALGNREDGVIVGGDSNIIFGNLISGNALDGIGFFSAHNNVAQANLIGTDIDGNLSLGNGEFGVHISTSGQGPANGNRVHDNVIAGNAQAGVAIFDGVSNSISRNRIFSNGDLGIRLNPGLTPNDPGDFDTGPNELMNFPVLTRADASPGCLLVQGTIDTPNPSDVVVEFFANPVPVPGGDPSGHGEGAVFLGSTTPNASGDFWTNLPTLAAGTLITATATDASGNTSEFALNITASSPAPNATPLTAVGPARAWIGLKNSDDVGTKFDLLAEVFKNGVLIGSGQLNGIPGGSSGFNNAVLRTIDLALSAPVDVYSGDTVSFRLSVKIAVGVAGHRSGTARLWFNDAAANTRIAATMGCVTSDHFLLNAFALGATAGPGPKKTIDVFVDRAVGGNPFKPFGTWSKTF